MWSAIDWNMLQLEGDHFVHNHSVDGRLSSKTPSSLSRMNSYTKASFNTKMSEYRLGLKKYILPVKFEFKVDFYALGAHVYTTEELLEEKLFLDSDNASSEDYDEDDDGDLYDEDLDKDFSPRFLVIEIHSPIDGTYGVNEIARCLRPRLLILQGILSFLGNYPFTIYQVIHTSSSLLRE